MRRKLTILAIFALMISSSISLTYATPEDGNTPSVYDTIREAAESRRDELLYLLDEDISNDVMNNLQTALQQMQEADESQDPQASLQLYMSALQNFRKTWSSYLKEDEEASQNTLACLLYTSPSPRDLSTSRMPSSA